MIILERRKTITFEVIILDHVGDQPSLKQKKKYEHLEEVFDIYETMLFIQYIAPFP